MRYIIVFIFSFYCSVLSCNEELVMTPAMFDDGPDALHNLIEFPPIADDIDLLVKCDVRVTSKGRMRQNVCYSKDDDTVVFEKKIHQAVRKARMQPAIVGGKQHKVYLQYMVHFNKVDTKKSIKVYPHHGHDITNYGIDYSSPQRYKEGVFNIFRRCSSGVNILVKADIDEDGKVQNVELAGSYKKDNPCTRYILKMFPKGAFVPAYHEGKPVPAKIFESFYDFAIVEDR